jgi:hypothetical protein
MGPLSPNRLDHRPPDWLRVEPDYFITVCAEPRGVNHFCKSSVARNLEIGEISKSKQIWFCHLVVLMPDHIHLLVSFPDLPSFLRSSETGSTGCPATMPYRGRRTFLITAYGMAKTGQKAEYIQQNPVRAGLIAKAEDWLYIWIAER